MNHDFVKGNKGDEPGSTKNITRYDSKGRACLGQGGIMDYSQEVENDKTSWSTCSVEDFRATLDGNKTCLTVIDPKNPPANPTMPKMTDQECDLSKLYPGLNGVHFLILNGKL